MPAEVDTTDKSSQGGEEYKQEGRPSSQEHLTSRQYCRDLILGVNDGLVSTFLLVAGVVGGGMSNTDVLLTSVSGAIAGAISMFAGEYVATKSQNEVMTGEIKREAEHIRKYHAEEVQELTQLFTQIGIPRLDDDQSARSRAQARNLRRLLTEYYTSNQAALLQIMVALEFGVISDEVRSPIQAGLISFCTFILGAMPSVVPFAIVDDPKTGLIVSAVACGLCLFMVGVIKGFATRGNVWTCALENLVITSIGSGVSYSIGIGFQKLIET